MEIVGEIRAVLIAAMIVFCGVVYLFATRSASGKTMPLQQPEVAQPEPVAPPGDAPELGTGLQPTVEMVVLTEPTAIMEADYESELRYELLAAVYDECARLGIIVPETTECSDVLWFLPGEGV